MATSNTYVNFTPYDEQMAELQRRQKLADLMQQQAIQPLETPQSGGRMIAKISPLAGLAKMLQAYSAGAQSRDIEKQRGAAEEQARSQAMDYYRGFQPSVGVSPDAALQASMTPTARPNNVPFNQSANAANTQTESALNLPSGALGRAPEEAATPIATPAPQPQVTALTGQQRLDRINQGMMSGNPYTRMMAQALMKPTEYEGGVKFSGNDQPYMVSKTGEIKFLNDPRLTPRDEFTSMTANKVADLGWDMTKFNNLSADQRAQVGIALSNNDIARARLAFETGVGVRAPNVGMQQTSGAQGAAPNVGTQGVVKPVQQTAAQMPSAQKPSTQPAAAIPQVNNPSIAPAQRQKLTLEMPQAKQSAIGTLNKMQQLEDYLTALENHPGLERITGKVDQYEWTDMTDEARNARAIYNTLKNATSIEAIAQARAESKTGGAYGSMTEQEWPRLETSFGAIQNSQDAKDLRIAIRNAKKQIQAAKQNAQNAWNQIYGADTLGWKPTEFEMPSYNKQTENQALHEQAARIIAGG